MRLRSDYGIGEVLSRDPVVCVVDEFLPTADCRHVIEHVAGRLDPAKVSRLGENAASDKRTNRVAWVPHDETPVVRSLVDRLAGLVGVPADHAESLQVVHYATGQEYLAHFDAWDVTTEKGQEKTQLGGNRVLTALVYLNEVGAGGGTAFPELDLEVAPVPGRLCLFHDLDADGIGRHPRSLHAGLPVLAGEKWACNLWFRERAYRTDPAAVG